jgi:tetratricopeptide (TPR) repeat protein
MKQAFQIVPPDSSNSTATHIETVKPLRMHRFTAALMLVLLFLPSLGISAAAVGPETDAILVASPSRKELKISDNAVADINASLNVRRLNTSIPVTAATDKDCTLAEELLSQANKSRENVEAAFKFLREQGLEIPREANGSYNLGFDAVEEAVELMETGDFNGAIEQAFQALQHLGDAFVLVQNVAEVSPGDVEKEAERAIGLMVAIDRASTFIDRLNGTLSNIVEEDIDVSEIEMKMVEAVDLLRWASKSLENGEIEEAEGKLAETRDIIEDASSPFNNTVRYLKIAKTERFVDYVETNIQSLQWKITRLQNNIEAERIEKTTVALQAVSHKVQGIRVCLYEGMVEDAINELSEAVHEIDEGLNELNGEGISIQLKAMNIAEARVQVLKSTTERLALRGENTSKVDAELEKTEALLDEMMDQLEKGNTEAAQELLEEAEENFNEVQENIHISSIKERAQESVRNKLREEQSDSAKDDILSISP